MALAWQGDNLSFARPRGLLGSAMLILLLALATRMLDTASRYGENMTTSPLGGLSGPGVVGAFQTVSDWEIAAGKQTGENAL